MSQIDANALRNRLDAHDYRQILQKLGFEISRKSGTNLSGILGPSELGEGKKGNFSVDLEKGFVKDFGSSGYEGDVFDAVQDVLGLSFPEALRWIVDELNLDASTLERKAGGGQSERSSTSDSDDSNESPQEPEPVVSRDWVFNWHTRLMGHGEVANAARHYLLEERGLNGAVLKAANVGLASREEIPDGDSWRGFHRSEADHVKWWMIFPVARRDKEDHPITFVKGVAFNPETVDWERNEEGEKIPSNAGPTVLWDLVPTEEDGSPRIAGPVVVCEGEIDALCAVSHGFNAVTGTGGAKTFKLEWADYIADLSPAQEHSVVVAYDGDKDGRKYAQKTVAPKLYEAGVNVQIASLPDDTDVNDVLVEGGSADLHAHIVRADPYEPESELEVNGSTERSDSSDEDDREYKPFPLGTLPQAVEEYVRAATHALGQNMAPAMVCVPTLSVLAGAIGNSARLKLKESWTELATLWCAIVAISGSTKSPAFDHALRPIYKREQEAKEEYEQDLEDWKDKEDPDPQGKPTRDRYRTGDATPEAVVKILEDNPRGILLARDEIGAWIGSFDRYVSGAADLQFWIEVWGGIQASRDRAGEGNVTISDPVVPVTGTIQPGTLKEKLGEIHFDTGFASRLILCEPPTREKRWTEADVSRKVRDRYDRLLNGLIDAPEGTVVPLSPDAKELWVDYYNSANASMEKRPEGPLRAVVAKSITHTARLALILHRARQECGEEAKSPDSTVPVGVDTMRDALRLGKWLKEETLRVYQKHNLGAEARPPIRRFMDKLPEEFETAEAKEIAEEHEIPERTCEKWLSDLTDSSDLEKIKRGLYRKT